VLVVDDNATDRQILETVLANWKMIPTAVPGAVEAMAALQQAAKAGRPFRIILLEAMIAGMDGFELAGWIQRQSNGVRDATILMLTSAGCRGDAARSRELGIASYLVKPIQQAELLDAFHIVLSKGRRKKPRPAPRAQGWRKNRRQKRNILLTEDNPVNARLAVRTLEKEGYVVRVVSNGQEALAALDQEPFDVVLMDVQMPEMDGFEATRRIRERETRTGAHIPILAITAHALPSDRDRCLEAGMDGYLSKPVDSRALREAIVHHLTSTVPPPPEPGPRAPSSEALSKEELLARLDNDSELLVEMIQLFRENTPKLMAQIGAAVERSDTDALALAAHSFKGSAGNFGPSPAFRCAATLEELARKGDLSAALQAAKKLTEEAVAIQQFLDRMEEEVMVAHSDRR